ARDGQAEASPDRRMADFELAAKYLQKARTVGPPEGRDGQLAYLLGASLVESGGAQASIPILEQALADKNQPQQEIHSLLVRAILAAPDPDLELALKHNQAVVRDLKLTGAQRDQAWLLRAETLIRLHRNDEALAAIAQAPRGGSMEAKRLVLLGRLAMDEAA